MTPDEAKEIIVKELPALLEKDPEIHRFFLNISRRHFADKIVTEDRFDRILDEIRRDREEQSRKWEANQQALERDREEQSRKWEANQQALERDREAQNRKWEANHQVLEINQEEQNRKWDEQHRKWEANQQALEHDREERSRKWDEQNRKWEANQQALEHDREERSRKWEEQNRKWEANQQVINEILKDIHALVRKHDTTIGALGARWGLHTEQAFREALKGILEEFANVEVINVLEFDDDGMVFGRPDQIELDLIVKNGTLIIVEIKSSMSKSEMYTFERKVRFYEKRHQRQVDKMIVISPMVAPKAIPVAEKLGVHIYTAAEDVKI